MIDPDSDPIPEVLRRVHEAGPGGASFDELLTDGLPPGPSPARWEIAEARLSDLDAALMDREVRLRPVETMGEVGYSVRVVAAAAFERPGEPAGGGEDVAPDFPVEFVRDPDRPELQDFADAACTFVLQTVASAGLAGTSFFELLDESGVDCERADRLRRVAARVLATEDALIDGDLVLQLVEGAGRFDARLIVGLDPFDDDELRSREQ